MWLSLFTSPFLTAILCFGGGTVQTKTLFYTHQVSSLPQQVVLASWWYLWTQSEGSEYFCLLCWLGLTSVPVFLLEQVCFLYIEQKTAKATITWKANNQIGLATYKFKINLQMCIKNTLCKLKEPSEKFQSSKQAEHTQMTNESSQEIRDGNGGKSKSLKVGVRVRRRPTVGSRGNAPDGDQGALPPDAEGISKSKLWKTPFPGTLSCFKQSLTKYS